eukprot:7899512-Karenia_brevis.AAC.1
MKVTPHGCTPQKLANSAPYYARHREFPFDTRCDCGVFGAQDTVKFKTFQLVFGMSSKAPYPNHGGKIERHDWTKN